MFATDAVAETVKLAWDAVTDARAAVYQVHYGTASGQYRDQVESSTNSATLQNLQPGKTYYIAVRACDSARVVCSGFSNEVSTTIAAPPPVAAFSVNKVSGDAPLTVTFTDGSSGDITGRTWNFGDGQSTSGGTFVTYTYTVPGQYAPSLTVTGPGGSDQKINDTAISVSASSNDSGSGDDGSNDPPIGNDSDGNTDDGTTPDEPLFEVGQIQIDHEWQRVDFKNTFVDPVVIVRRMARTDVAPSVVRIDALDSEGFMVRTQRWDYLDGKQGVKAANYLSMGFMARMMEWDYLRRMTTVEEASYLVVERGLYRLADGSWIEADWVQTDATGTFVEVPFSATFNQPPVVFTAVGSYNDPQPVTTRVDNISQYSFELTMQMQESSPPEHAPETIAYIAWEPSIGMIADKSFEVGLVEDAVTDRGLEFLPHTAFSTEPFFVAGMQTTYEMDTAILRQRWADTGGLSVQVWVEEEESADQEIGHAPEVAGYLFIGE